jgi:peptidoglycan/LPS O-acetylase OafA/YrhL
VSIIANNATSSGTPKHPFGSRLPGLDGLRGLAAVSIMLLHATGSVGWPQWGLFTELVKSCGPVAVPLFFVLSGFLITHLLLDEEERIGRISLKNFYARRALRILPASLFYLAVVAVLTPLLKLTVEPIEIIAAATWWRNFLYNGWAGWAVHNTEGTHYTGHYWSLSVEEHFYFVWPLLLILLPRRWRLPLLGSLLAVVPLWRAYGMKIYSFGGLNYWRTDYMLDHLVGGALLAVLFRLPAATAALRRLALKPLLGLGVAISFIALSSSFDRLIWQHHITNKILTLQASVLMVGLVLLVATAVQIKDGRLHPLLNNPVMLWFGKISFSLYLWQQMFSGHEFRSWPEHVPWNLLLSLLAATASCYLIELPFLNLRGRFHSGPRPAP